MQRTSNSNTTLNELKKGKASVDVSPTGLGAPVRKIVNFNGIRIDRKTSLIRFFTVGVRIVLFRRANLGLGFTFGIRGRLIRWGGFRISMKIARVRFKVGSQLHPFLFHVFLETN